MSRDPAASESSVSSALRTPTPCSRWITVSPIANSPSPPCQADRHGVMMVMRCPLGPAAEEICRRDEHEPRLVVDETVLRRQRQGPNRSRFGGLDIRPSRGCPRRAFDRAPEGFHQGVAIPSACACQNDAMTRRTVFRDELREPSARRRGGVKPWNDLGRLIGHERLSALRIGGVPFVECEIEGFGRQGLATIEVPRRAGCREVVEILARQGQDLVDPLHGPGLDHQRCVGDDVEHRAERRIVCGKPVLHPGKPGCRVRSFRPVHDRGHGMDREIVDFVGPSLGRRIVGVDRKDATFADRETIGCGTGREDVDDLASDRDLTVIVDTTMMAIAESGQARL